MFSFYRLNIVSIWDALFFISFLHIFKNAQLHIKLLISNAVAGFDFHVIINIRNRDKRV